LSLSKPSAVVEKFVKRYLKEMPKLKANGINICYEIHGEDQPPILESVNGFSFRRFFGGAIGVRI
jgi:hypothetical protein